MTIPDTDRCRKPSPPLPKSTPKPQTLNPRNTKPALPNKSTKIKFCTYRLTPVFRYWQQYVHLITHTKYRSFLTLPKTYILIATKDQFIKSSEPQLALTPSALYNPKP